MNAQRSPSWLLDKSAYVKMTSSPDEPTWSDRAERGLIKVTAATVLEIGYSARSAREWTGLVRSPPISLLPRVYLTPQIEDRAIELQSELVRRGQHRAPSVSDLLLAAAAESVGLVVLHDDKDFELISEVTGQPVERLRY